MPQPADRLFDADEKPSAIVRRHLFVSPYHEEDIPALARTLGASQVLFGSDVPHPEGLAEPAQFAEENRGAARRRSSA